MLPKKLQEKLDHRETNLSLRVLPDSTSLVDLSSNDYLGFSSTPVFAKAIKSKTQELLSTENKATTGATGSRLLTGNHSLFHRAERAIAAFHKSETALIFNSGYDANISVFQSIPQRGDLIVYDEYIHASIRDGIQMSHARGYKFKHNNAKDLQKTLERISIMHHVKDRPSTTAIYVVTESVFSMDGDSPDLAEIVEICKEYSAYCIVDEAHALGVKGSCGEGLVCQLGLQKDVFLRVVTFGKALGTHGAAVLGGTDLRRYLINFARAFIYTTALPPHSVATILAGYTHLESREAQSTIEKLQNLITHFNLETIRLQLDSKFIQSTSAIHCAVIMGNKEVKTLSRKLQSEGYDIRPILSPTVPKGQERLRICLHSFNTKEQISCILELIKQLEKHL